MSDTPRKALGTAVITGGSRGIGAAVAKGLAREGYAVVVNYLRDAASADAVVSEITYNGGVATAHRSDVSDPHAVEALIRHAEVEFGAVTAVVHSAGAAIDRRRLIDGSWDDIQRQLDVHVRGAFLTARAVLPSMMERRFGRLVLITSQYAYGPPPAKMGGYAIAKSALAGLMRSLAVEASPLGVTVNAVAPGMIDTDLSADVPQPTKLAVGAQSPLRRLSSVDAVADAVVFLVSDAASEVTGQTLHLSGGLVMS